jgi:hypothetical protein
LAFVGRDLRDQFHIGGLLLDGDHRDHFILGSWEEEMVIVLGV